MDEKTMVLKSFKQNWQKARNDGWTITENIFYPPKNHDANIYKWAAYFYEAEYGILIPHWFIKFYPIDY